MKIKTGKTNFVHIGSILEDVLKACRREPGGGELMRVRHVWGSIVDEPVLKNARPAALKGRILLVNVTSSAWVHQLQFFRGEMIARLNGALGVKLVDDLKFRIGPV